MIFQINAILLLHFRQFSIIIRNVCKKATQSLKGMVAMNNMENTRDDSVLYVLTAVIAALSFLMGFIAGTALTKAVTVKKHKNCCGEFDVNEYVRSLGFDE